MPGNPLTDPNWANDLAATVERVVGTVRDKATTPIVHLTRALVYGLIAAFLGVFALGLLLVMATRGIQSLLDVFLEWPRAVYASYLIVGGILCLAGLVVLRTRRADES
jgi:hypothetical protein